METVFDKLKKQVVELLGVTPEEVTSEAHFLDDLGADSLDIVELTLACEQIFGIDIPDEEAERLETVGALAAYLEERIK